MLTVQMPEQYSAAQPKAQARNTRPYMIVSRQAQALLTALVAGAIALAGGAASQDASAPETPPRSRAPMALGAAANFSQGWSEVTHSAAVELGVEEFRDSILWSDVERTPGEYSFTQRKTQYPERLAESGGHLVLTVSGSNPLYDDGQTPHSPEAVAAFARFVAAVVRQYPAISAVEVGNEFNSGDFVTGPVRAGGIGQRAGYHIALVEAVAREVRRIRPDLPILGGATHSLPAGYLWSVLERADPGLIDGLAVHPYTTDVDQLPAQTGVLRRNPRARSLPLHVTEYGTKSEADAPDHMLRGYAAMASLGFAALHWYPLNERADGMVPLIRRDGSVTGAGEAFRFIRAQLSSRIARDISPDPFTFVHAFAPPGAGDDRLVLWGEPRKITLVRGDILAFDARGNRLDPAQLALSADHAVVLAGPGPIRLGEDVLLDCTTLVADSFYQFSYPQRGGQIPPSAFASTLRIGGEERALGTMPGQQRAGVPWVPYLGVAGEQGMRLTAERIVLAGGPAGGAALLQRWVPEGAGPLRIEAEFTPIARGPDPFSVEISQGGQVLFAQTGAQAVRFVGELASGNENPLVFAVDSGNARAVSADYRFRIHDEARCRSGSLAGSGR